MECRNFIEDSTIRRTSAVLHDAYLYRFPSATVLWIAPRDDDRPGRDESAELDLVQQDRTVEDQNAVNSRIVSQVDDSQRMTSSRATPMVGEASDPIPQWAEPLVHYSSMESRDAVEDPTIQRTSAVIQDVFLYRSFDAILSLN
ncbi:hypothetical protein QAD02_008044 [Eretmocerus hayati]|uniref:Uncharacterized protein n=1 Tax=Eretmocerus hayati TaxID=131215 RepID=A0ACC2N5N0_9HYME|nr:hypothetical protein QAD02_008044 [Eretmocerus hayati]